MKITIDIPEHILDKISHDNNARIPIIESLVHISVRDNMRWCVIPEGIVSMLEQWSERDNFPIEHLIGKLTKTGLEQAMLTGEYPLNPDTQKNIAVKFMLAMFNPTNANYALDPIELMLISSSLHIPINQLEESLKQAKTRLNLIEQNIKIKRDLVEKLINEL
jgi:hypothetical protein